MVDRTAIRIAALNAEAAGSRRSNWRVKESGNLVKLRELKALSLEGRYGC